MIDTGLRGKVALVTGGNHGIGAATALALAAQGARVFITYLRLQETSGLEEMQEGNVPGKAAYLAARAQSADQVMQAIRNQGGEARAWEADLSDPPAIPALFDRVEAAIGPVDVLVNNAAHWEPDTFLPHELVEQTQMQTVLTVTPESHDRHFAVNCRAVALMMAEYARRHIARGATWGRIVNISTDGSPCFPREASYGASKHALESYSGTAAAELGRYGVTVNIVSPGPIQTAWITSAFEAHLSAATPLGRVGQPDDVADAIVFLASEQARWLTGQLLHVGGGHRMF